MNIQWVSSSFNVSIPENAVIGGVDSEGCNIYIGRSTYENDLLPVNIIPDKKIASVSFATKEWTVNQFELLCGSGFSWVEESDGNIPENAVVGGKTYEGEILYIGRTKYNGFLTPGKVHKSHECLYFPFDGLEKNSKQYEVLIQQELKSMWIRSTSLGSVPDGAVVGGCESDGSKIYIGRAFYNFEQMPVKIIPKKQLAYIFYEGKERLVEKYDVLCHGKMNWITCNGRIPPNAVPCGRTKKGEIIYIGRTRGSQAGSLTFGRVFGSNGVLNILYGGAEIILINYEILVELGQ